MFYLKKIFKTGAITRTPERIINAIVREAKLVYPQVVIEFGCGRGEITKHLYKDKAIKLYGFETENTLIEKLKSKYSLGHFFKHSAIDFASKIPPNTKVDYFICSFPLSFYSEKELINMFTNMKSLLSKEGKIIILFHAKWLVPMLKKEFTKLVVKTFFHLPPYYLAVYKKEN